jgi:hypothetical protein
LEGVYLADDSEGRDIKGKNTGYLPGKLGTTRIEE